MNSKDMNLLKEINYHTDDLFEYRRFNNELLGNIKFLKVGAKTQVRRYYDLIVERIK